MIEAHEQEIKTIEEAWVEITNLKEIFHSELADMREDSHARIHGLWDELTLAKEENRWLWDEHHQSCNWLCNKGPLHQVQGRVQQVE